MIPAGVEALEVLGRGCWEAIPRPERAAGYLRRRWWVFPGSHGRNLRPRTHPIPAALAPIARWRTGIVWLVERLERMSSGWVAVCLYPAEPASSLHGIGHKAPSRIERPSQAALHLRTCPHVCSASKRKAFPPKTSTPREAGLFLEPILHAVSSDDGKG